MRPLPDWPVPYWIAHRGGGTLAPENTLAAFRCAAAQGLRGHECDVRLSADGIPFLLHDDTLDRTTDARGPASRLDWSALSQLDAGSWFGADWAGEPPASLAAVLRWVRVRQQVLNVELKPSPGQAAATGRHVAERLAQVWPDGRDPSPRPWLSSFEPAALAAARDAAPQFARALLLETLTGNWLDTAEQLGCAAVVVDQTLLDATLRQRLRESGLRVLCYTVNDPADMDRLAAFDVDGLITDALDRLPAPSA